MMHSSLSDNGQIAPAPTLRPRPLILKRLLVGGVVILTLFSLLAVVALHALRSAAEDHRTLVDEHLGAFITAQRLQTGIDQIVQLQFQAVNAASPGELQTLHDRIRDQLERLQQAAAALQSGAAAHDLRSSVHAATGELVLRNAAIADLRGERLELQEALNRQLRVIESFRRPLGPAPPLRSPAGERALFLLLALAEAPSELTLRRLAADLAVAARAADDLPDAAVALVRDPGPLIAARSGLLDVTRRLRALERQQGQLADRLQGLSGTVAERAEKAAAAHQEASTRRQSQLTGMLISTVALGLVALIGLWLALRRTLVDRLARLTQAVEAWQLGERGPSGVGGDDEVAAVAHAAERFVAQIDAQTSRLSDKERRLTEALHDAEQASRSKSTFLATMSHELRTPLNAIIGFSELMEAGIGGPLNARQGEYVRLIHDSGSHLLTLINDILDFSKIQAGQRELDEDWEDPGALAVTSLQMVQSLAHSKNLQIDLEVTPPGLLLLCDSRGFRQMLLNLLSNAIKYSPTDGRIAVVLAVVNDEFLISVTDQGPGIAPAQMARLFQAFVQINDSAAVAGHGTGLGLVIVRGLAELHGGRAWVESAVGKGTTAFIALPGTRLRGGSPSA